MPVSSNDGLLQGLFEEESVARSAESACLLWYLKETLETVAAGKAVSSRIF